MFASVTTPAHSKRYLKHLIKRSAIKQVIANFYRFYFVQKNPLYLPEEYGKHRGWRAELSLMKVRDSLSDNPAA
jgi:hypothetical protein